MNAPNRSELFIVPDEEPKVSVVDDSRIPSTSTITLNRQDHTIANLISNEMTKNKDVIFSGYRVPHPLNPRSECCDDFVG
ncbi:DNA-directed RNA polymerase II subunit rpb11 [Wallemia ichthyophaga EXF-994]|uniref:DNA-directed RNA polymerase II subunit rpb11 n=1 Tax=Wallemia ichthyophaga (strain EXF-994 / CBS 113033) TaxID=1299270 RepID=R9AIA9_WALI9|nr:DNA-directed RNA polymerase II subunit rpb11 [Wallemia ichthyophaga EXF-994]EOR01933.1 DNA-directed RNA polymerase II subunit rpb11 [Wallemia ichthyophaga EXF-994]